MPSNNQKKKMSNRSLNLDLGAPSLISKCNPESLKLLEKYKIDMTVRELSDLTIFNYLSDLRQWLRYVYLYQENKSVLEIDEDEFIQFLYFAKTGGNGTRRNKRRTASVSAFYKFLRRKKLIKENPLEFMERSKKDIDVYKQTFLTPEQVMEMKKKLKENGNTQLELYALLSLSTMARVTAISNLKWEQLNLEERIFENVLEKEGKIVTLYFNEECKELLKKLKAEREENGIEDGGWIFHIGTTKHKPISTNTLNDWAHKVGLMIGIPELHPHDFRHSGATLLKNAGMNLEDVSSLLNHASTDVTKKFYIKEDSKKIRSLKDQFEI